MTRTSYNDGVRGIRQIYGNIKHLNKSSKIKLIALLENLDALASQIANTIDEHSISFEETGEKGTDHQPHTIKITQVQINNFNILFNSIQGIVGSEKIPNTNNALLGHLSSQTADILYANWLSGQSR